MQPVSSQTTIDRLSSRPDGWRRTDWHGGSFETARRPRTPLVEGSIRSDRHLVMVTLRGGADRHEFRTADGSRYDGPDRPGSLSFLPAGCERRLRLHNVAWQWAAIGLDPEQHAALERLGPFCADEDVFALGLMQELERLDALEGELEPAYGETMSLALVRYLSSRFGRGPGEPAARLLPAWRLKRLREHTDAHLGGAIRIADLAACVGLSEGHFHRAFRATTGRTPLAFIQQRRVEAAIRRLTTGTASVTEIAFELGFGSPTHFARVFRSHTGRNPADFRRLHALD